MQGGLGGLSQRLSDLGVHHGGWVEGAWVYAVARKGHLADCKLCICAAHDEESRNDAPNREEWKGEKLKAEMGRRGKR